MRTFFDNAEGTVIGEGVFLFAFDETSGGDAIVNFAWRAKVKN